MKLSVIIPTLNEQAHIERTIAHARSRAAQPPIEIIVADCDSNDATVPVASGCGAILLTGPTLTSRARACNAGAAIATGDVLMFLHADSDPAACYDQLIQQALNGGAIGGAFEFQLDGPQWRLRFVEWVNRIRYRIRKRYFGDQGIFIRRDAFQTLGGFPDLAILEDAHFCGRAGRLGRMRLITTPMPTSPRRFYNGGILTTLAMDVLICLLDLIGALPETIADHYRADNIHRGNPVNAELMIPQH